MCSSPSQRDRSQYRRDGPEGQTRPTRLPKVLHLAQAVQWQEVVPMQPQQHTWGGGLCKRTLRPPSTDLLRSAWGRANVGFDLPIPDRRGSTGSTSSDLHRPLCVVSRVRGSLSRLYTRSYCRLRSLAFAPFWVACTLSPDPKLFPSRLWRRVALLCTVWDWWAMFRISNCVLSSLSVDFSDASPWRSRR